MAKYTISRPTSYLDGKIGRNFLVYGPPGGGKTTLVAYAKNALFLATDPQGPVSLLQNKDLRHVPFVELLTVDAVTGIVEDIVRNKNGMDAYDTFIVDTITTTQTYDLRELRKGVSNQQGKASQNEWALTNQHMSDYLFDLLTKTADTNIIVLAHDKKLYKKDAKNENVLVGIEPSLTPGSWETCKRLFSGIYYYAITATKPNVVRKLYTNAGTTLAVTKDRYGLKNEFVNPTWTDVENELESIRMRIKKEESIV